MIMKMHFWIFKDRNNEGEILYCQNCLCEIQVTVWKDTTDVKQISKPVFKHNCDCKEWKE